MIRNFLMELWQKGWTQEKIAEKAGISHSMISKYMKGQPCTLETAIKIADAFGVSLDEVVGRSTPEKKPISNSFRDHSKGRKLKSEL